jgi:hypothetical protein
MLATACCISPSVKKSDRISVLPYPANNRPKSVNLCIAIITVQNSITVKNCVAVNNCVS